MRVTRLLAISAAAATACTLAACSSGSSSDGSTVPAAAKPGEKVDLTFWTWAPGMDTVAAQWNSTHPDIHVTVNKQDGGDPAVTKLLTAIKAGSGAPDLMQTEYQKIPTLVSADALANLASVLPADTAKHYAPGTWQGVTLGSDAVYDVPQDSGPMEFYYRKDVFAKLGLTPPTTWEEYATVAKKVHAASPKTYLGTFSATDAGWFAGLTQQAGASWWGVDGQSWKVGIDSPAVRKVASYWGGLVEQGVIDNTPMYTPAWNAALNNGTQVGWVSAIWAPGVLKGNAGSTAGKWAMAPLPQWTAGGDATGAWGGSATSVTTQSKHPVEAAKFVSWMNSDPAGVAALVKEGGLYPADLPGQAALTTPPAFFSSQKDFYQVAAKVAAGVQPFTYGPNVNVAYSSYNDEFGKATQAKTASAFDAAITAMQATTVGDLTKSGFTVTK